MLVTTEERSDKFLAIASRFFGGKAGRCLFNCLYTINAFSRKRISQGGVGVGGLAIAEAVNGKANCDTNCLPYNLIRAISEGLAARTALANLVSETKRAAVNCLTAAVLEEPDVNGNHF